MVTFVPKSRYIIINCLKVKNDSYEEVLCSIRKGIFYSLILCLFYLLPCVSFLGGRDFGIFPTLCSHSFFCAHPGSEEPCMAASVTTSAKWPPGFLPALESSRVQSEHSVRKSRFFHAVKNGSQHWFGALLVNQTLCWAQGIAVTK